MRIYDNQITAVGLADLVAKARAGKKNIRLVGYFSGASGTTADYVLEPCNSSLYGDLLKKTASVLEQAPPRTAEYPEDAWKQAVDYGAGGDVNHVIFVRGHRPLHMKKPRL